MFTKLNPYSDKFAIVDPADHDPIDDDPWLINEPDACSKVILYYLILRDWFFCIRFKLVIILSYYITSILKVVVWEFLKNVKYYFNA